MKTLQQCEQFLGRVGLATVLPGKTALLPCLLWEAQGHRGPFSGADQAFHNVWKWKDELPQKRLAWAGRLLGGQVILLHVSLLPAFLGARGRLSPQELYEDGGLSREAHRLWQTLQATTGSLSRAELKSGMLAKDFDRACRELERLLVLTRSGSVALNQGWDSNSYALVERHFAQVIPLPHGPARQLVKESLQRAAPEASEAQLRRWLKSIG
ncbi:hypothetical protein JST97_14745 [bacterium]|nr:hypothetical protein [bacterium]